MISHDHTDKYKHHIQYSYSWHESLTKRKCENQALKIIKWKIRKFDSICNEDERKFEINKWKNKKMNQII